MRCTVAGETPLALASERQLQCVSPGGFSCNVALTISATFSWEIRAGLPRPGRTRASPSGPSSQKRLRQSITVGRPTPTARAIDTFE